MPISSMNNQLSYRKTVKRLTYNNGFVSLKSRRNIPLNRINDSISENSRLSALNNKERTHLKRINDSISENSRLFVLNNKESTLLKNKKFISLKNSLFVTLNKKTPFLKKTRSDNAGFRTNVNKFNSAFMSTARHCFATYKGQELSTFRQGQSLFFNIIPDQMSDETKRIIDVVLNATVISTVIPGFTTPFDKYQALSYRGNLERISFRDGGESGRKFVSQVTAGYIPSLRASIPLKFGSSMLFWLSKSELDTWNLKHKCLAFSGAAIIENLITSPAHTTLQIMRLDTTGKTTFTGAAKELLKQKNPLVFWRGNTVCCIASTLYNTVTLPLSTELIELIKNHTPSLSQKAEIGVQSIIGATVGALSNSITFPLYRVSHEQRLLPVGEPKPSESAYKVIQRVLLEEGYKGFYKGLPMNTLRTMLSSGLMTGLIGITAKMKLSQSS